MLSYVYMFSNYSIVDMINAGIKPYSLREIEPEVEPIKKLDYKSRPYYNEVWRLTEEKAHMIEGIEERSWKGKHIEHIVPVSYGEKHNIPAELIGSLENLTMLDRHENMRKGRNLSASSRELLKKWGYELS